MKTFINLLFVLFSILLIVYVWPQSPPFPVPPPDALQSQELADTETTLRRAYFTNYTREQVVEHYISHFARDINLRLNYPPEDAQTLIRDQTRSYYLEELVHPMRESLFINGFIAQSEKDDIWIAGKHWEEKITIRYIPTRRTWRVLVVIMTMGILYLLTFEWLAELKQLRKIWSER
jgi:hypothetical protein